MLITVRKKTKRVWPIGNSDISYTAKEVQYLKPKVIVEDKKEEK